MNDRKYARTVRELVVYVRSRAAARAIFELTKSFPKEETYSLTDQIRRSSRSIGAQIAEAWAKRRYEKHFVAKLTDADSEQHETRHWVDLAEECGYIDAAQAAELNSMLSEVGRMLNAMIDKADLFCSTETTHSRESVGEYITVPYNE